MNARNKRNRTSAKPTRQKHYGERYERMRQILFNASCQMQEQKAQIEYKKCKIAAVIDKHGRVQAVTVEHDANPKPDLDALEKVFRDGGGKVEYLNCNLDNIGRRAGR